MNRQLILKNLKIPFINFEDYTYAIAPNDETKPNDVLVKSISRYGVLHPPVVKKVERDAYVIITGRNRLATFRNVYPERFIEDCKEYQESLWELKSSPEIAKKKKL